MKSNLLVSIFFLMLFLMSACSDDKDELVTIEDNWIRNHPVTDVPIRINFNADGTFLWEPREETDQHTPSSGSYTYENEVLTIFDDEDCADIDGRYEIMLSNNSLEVDVIEDACEPRIAGMKGVWTSE